MASSLSPNSPFVDLLEAYDEAMAAPLSAVPSELNGDDAAVAAGKVTDHSSKEKLLEQVEKMSSELLSILNPGSDDIEESFAAPLSDDDDDGASKSSKDKGKGRACAPLGDFHTPLHERGGVFHGVQAEQLKDAIDKDEDFEGMKARMSAAEQDIALRTREFGFLIPKISSWEEVEMVFRRGEEGEGFAGPSSGQKSVGAEDELGGFSEVAGSSYEAKGVVVDDEDEWEDVDDDDKKEDDQMDEEDGMGRV